MRDARDAHARHPILWSPSQQWLDSAQLTRYVNWLAGEHGRRFADYEALRRWSIDDLEGFWGSIWDYFAVRGDGPREPVLAQREMPGAAWFPGVRVNWAEHVLSDRDPACLAVLHGSESQPLRACDWSELTVLTRRVRAGLLDAGVGRGDRVAALLPTRLETLALLLATASLGAVFSCVAPEMGAASVLDRFTQIEPTVLVAVDGYEYNGRRFDLTDTVARVRDALPTLARTVVLDTPDWDAFIAHDAPLRFERVAFDHPLWILYSSGTTGAPKAIVHGHGGILLEHLKKLHLHVDLGPGDRLFWFTTTGWMMWNFLVGGLLTGAAIVLYDGSPKHPDLGVLWDVCAAGRVTVFGCSAGYLTACMGDRLSPRDGRDLSRLRAIGSTGSPLLGPVFDWVYDHVDDDVWLFSSSGGTDVCTSFVGGVPTLPVRRGELQARSLGAAIEAWNPAGRPVIGELGELVITEPMPSMPVGFWGDHDGDRLRESYFDTYPGAWRHGDWIEITAEGGVIISGRSDATINRGGVRFGSGEIYGAVLADPDVVDALVVDVTNADGSSWLPLFVVMREGVSLDDAIVARVRGRLLRDCSPRHLPDQVIAVDQVPRTLSGKPLEVPIKRILMGDDPDAVLDRSTLADPAALDAFLAVALAEAGARTPPGLTAAARTPAGPTARSPQGGRVALDRPCDGVLRLTIDHPQRRNALDERMLAAMADAIEGAEESAIVIRGAGATFSAGYDLRDLLGPGFPERAAALVAHPRHRLFDALEHSAATVIAELGGPALGGGLELAICCDLRFAAASTVVGMPAGRLGLTYSHTGLRRFVETIGLAATKELFLLGRRLPASRARELGIVTEVHEDAALDAAVLQAAREIAALAPRARASNKLILERLRGTGRALDADTESELEDLQRACFDQAEFAEGVRAFLARRDPHWTEPPSGERLEPLSE